MKKKNLNLEVLKVESFVTDLTKDIVKTVKGGATLGCSAPINCNLSDAGGPYCSAYCSDLICPATFGTGGNCGPVPSGEGACNKK